MATISVKGSKELLRKFEKLEQESRRKNNGDVVVGYAASYALIVHENLETAHGVAFNVKHGGKPGFKNRGPNQQAKYLEQPFRELRSRIMEIVAAAMKNGASLINGLLTGGRFLQRESQKLVPVDTGNLKGSAFTERE